MAQKLKKKIKQKQVIVKKPKVVVSDHASKTKNVVKFIAKSTYVEGIGRRKTAVARVRIYEEKGDFLVNNLPAGQYFRAINNASALFNQPLHDTETHGNWAVVVSVKGSGIASQLDAVIHGLARALNKKNPDFHTILKTNGYLTRDSRMKETRKVGMGGKARRQRQSPKR